jgi:hypothetical protein
MSEQPIPGGNGGYEHEDMGARAVFGFLLGLAVLVVVVYFAGQAIYGSLEKYSRAHQPQQNPLKQKAETNTRDTDTGKVREEIKKAFPEPRLETDERNELAAPRMEEEEHLNSYGWVDQPAGVVHIPIDRAIQLVAERGLAVRPPTEVSQKDRASEGKQIPKAAKQPGKQSGKP